MCVFCCLIWRCEKEREICLWTAFFLKWHYFQNPVSQAVAVTLPNWAHWQRLMPVFYGENWNGRVTVKKESKKHNASFCMVCFLISWCIPIWGRFSCLKGWWDGQIKLSFCIFVYSVYYFMFQLMWHILISLLLLHNLDAYWRIRILLKVQVWPLI